MHSIVADSNFFRHVESIPKHVISGFNPMRITNKYGLEKKIEAAGKKGILAVADLNLVIYGEIKYATEREARIELAKCVTEEIVLKLGIKARTTKLAVALMPPLPILKPTEYNKVHADVLDTIREVVERRKLPIKILPGFPEEKIEWEEDGTHLSDTSGRRYVKHLMDQLVPMAAEQKMDSSDSEEVEEVDVVTKIQRLAETSPGENIGFKKQTKGSRIDRMDVTIKKLIRKGQKDNLEFAAINEKLDKWDNEGKKNSLIVAVPRGFPEMVGPTETETNFEQRKGVIEQLFGRFIDSGEYTITAVRHLNPGKRGQQLSEVTFETMAQAGLVRKTFVQKVQNQTDLQDAVINLNQSPATRTRVEILKLMAKRIKESKKNCDAIVVSHLPKPILVFEDSSGKKRPLSYIQAVKSWKHLLDEADVNKIADKMRRNGFYGSPAHAFGFLEEQESDEERDEETEKSVETEKTEESEKSTKSKLLGKRPGKRPYAEVAAGSSKNKMPKK